MSETGNIHYLTHQEIDKVKWDACIEKAGNGLIYGYSFYLDHMAKHWDALVLCKGPKESPGRLLSENEYEAIMPLTWNKKFGIHYLYQPFLTAQLGIFGKAVTGELTEVFLKSIPAKFRYWDISLNHENVFSLNDFKLRQRSNFVLDLNNSYEKLYKGYKENIQRNIRKAERTGCTVQRDFDVERVIELALRQMKSYTKESADNVERFRKLYQSLHQQQKAINYGIASAQNRLLASCVFFFSHNRAYYILVGNDPNGKIVGASHALIDAFIKDHAATNLLLDFEGSDIPGLAFFYGGFGAVEEKYAAITLNRLPFYLKWIKR